VIRTSKVAAALLLAACAAPRATSPGAPPASAPAASARTEGAARLDRPWSDDIVYFVLVDRFANGDRSNDVAVKPGDKGAFHGGDLKGLLAHVDEIAGLGITALWVNPLVDNIDGFVTGAGFPDWAYHGYWADDFTRLDARFGSEADLRALVDACHARGIKVLLDVVYNHAGYGSHYITDPRTRDWIRSNEGSIPCGDDDLTSCVAGLPDFKTELREVADWLIPIQLGWAERVGLDGFRLDTVKHVDHPFWQDHRARSRERLGRRFFLLGEVWGGDADVLDPYFEKDELDAGFDFGFQGNTLSWVEGRGRTVAFDRYLASRGAVRPGYHLAHFLSSHDVPGALFQLQGDVAAFRMAAALQMTTSGIPVVYYGEEVARSGGDWPENRSDMPWGDRDVAPGAGQPRDEALRDFYVKLIATRRAHPALSRGAHQALATDGDLYVFARRDAESRDVVVVAANRGSAPASARVATPAEWADKLPADALGAGQWKPGPDGQSAIEIAPRGVAIFALPR
jgi:alpha-amylase